jgi:FixJ family two-component response regulator
MDSELRTVFIVEDSAEVRNALSRVLRVAGHHVRSFESAERFLSEHDRAAPGCLLLDICMPGLNGIELQRELAASPAARPIVFLTGMGDIQTSVHAMKEGAVDFLTKPVDADRLLAAIDQALSRDSQQRMQLAIRQTFDRRFKTLTPRERLVMAHVVRGRLNKQIAGILGCGGKTIKVHRARVMAKMRVHSVAELVRAGARVGLGFEPVQPPPAGGVSGLRTIRSNDIVSVDPHPSKR